MFADILKAIVIAIRQKETIKGITIGTEETKLLQFANDTSQPLC